MPQKLVFNLKFCYYYCRKVVQTMNVVEQLKQEARKLNLKTIRSEIDEAWVAKKINNHLERHPYLNITFDEIKTSILSNDLIASFFIKDPSKQNFSEKMFATLISNIEGVEDFEDLSSSTDLYLKNGKLVRLANRPINLKTVDYLFEYKGNRYICTQKYTNEKGGAQDNQYHDVATFLQNSIGLSKEDGIAIALVDGDYYTVPKVVALRQINRKAIVCSAFELEEILNQ